MTMHDPRVGQEFGDYIVTRKLAEGGMGAVYLAEHPGGMRKVVKYVLAECLKIPEIRERFKSECNAAKRLKGKSGIVDIDSYGERNGEMYLVMEYLDGVTLESHIRQNQRLTPHHAFVIALQILKALDALHREGIIHRDLKPSNVFLRYNPDDRVWEVKLIDFGIVHDNHAAVKEFRTRQGQMIGTPGYMATEQYGRADQVTPATDLFAVAICLWEMLTGGLPWGIADNEFAQHDRQLNQVPLWPSHVPLEHAEQWPEILVSTLAPDPARRPQTAQVLALLLAQRLAPMPPFVMGGIEMVERIAPRFLRDLPADLETVRHPHPQRAAAMFLPQQTAAPLVGPGSSPGSLDAIPISAVSAPVTPVSAPTVSARPYAPGSAAAQATPQSLPSAVPAMKPTTLSASNGVSVAAGTVARSFSWSRLTLIGLATVLATAGIIIGVTQLRSRSATAQGSAAEEESLDSAAAQPMPSLPESTATGSETPSLPPAAVAPPDAAIATAPSESVGSASAGQTATIQKPDTSDETSNADSVPAATAADAGRRPSSTRTTNTKKVRATSERRSGAASSSNTSAATTSRDTANASGSASGPRAGSGTFDPDAIKE